MSPFTPCAMYLDLPLSTFTQSPMYLLRSSDVHLSGTEGVETSLMGFKWMSQKDQGVKWLPDFTY